MNELQLALDFNPTGSKKGIIDIVADPLSSSLSVFVFFVVGLTLQSVLFIAALSLTTE